MSEPSKAWALCSGGKDSVTTAHYLSSTGRLSGIVFLDTGISIPGAKEFVAAFAETLGAVFESYLAPVTYESFVRKFGFPGPGGHYLAVNYLKGRSVRAFGKAHPGAWLASGVRSKESHRRSITTREFGKWEGVPTWAPIYDWTTERVWEYVKANDIQVSPAYKTLHISGECLCGSFASEGEGYILQTFYPDVAKRIAALERETGGSWGRGSNRVSVTRIEEFACSECPRKP